MTRQIVQQETLVSAEVQQAVTDASPKRFDSDLDRDLAYSQRVVDLLSDTPAARPPLLGEPSVVYDSGEWGSVDVWNGVAWVPLQAVAPEDAGLVTLEVADATAVTEPTSGHVFANFLVTLTGTPRSKISVKYISEELNPLAEFERSRMTNPDPSNARYLTDFGDAIGNTLLFDPDSRATDHFGDKQTMGGRDFYTATIRVPVYADLVAEAQERFQVRLYGERNARLDRSIGVAVIGEANLPVVNIYDAPDVVTTNAPTQQGSPEIRIGATTATFTVKLETGTAPVGGIAFTAELGDITATSGVDYSPLGQTSYVIPSGSSEVSIVVTIPAQVAESRDERFYCRITPATGARALFARRYATAVIKGTDTRSTLYMDSIAAGDVYRDDNPTFVDIPWYMSPAAASDVTLRYWTVLDELNTDPLSRLTGLFPYRLRDNPDLLRIRAGTTSGFLRLRVNSFFRYWTDSDGNPTTKTDEHLTFHVVGQLVSDAAARLARADSDGVATLSQVELGIVGSEGRSERDASDPPQVSIFPVNSPQPETVSPAQFRIRLSRTPSSTVRVNWSTRTGGNLGNASTADFSPSSGFVQWPVGTTTLEYVVSVPVLHDSINEEDEYFSVVLSDLQGTAEMAVSSARHVILGTQTSTVGNQISLPPSFVIQAPNTGVRTIQILAVPSRPAPAGGLTANVSYTALTATENTHYRVTRFGDFDGSPTTLSWDEGSVAPQQIEFQILDAPVIDPVDFQIRITLPPAHSDWVSGGLCRVSILPQAPLSRRLPRLSVGNVTKDEDAPGLFQIPFTLDEAPGTGRSASVEFTTIGQSARPGDYGLPTGNPQGHSVAPSGEIFGMIVFTGTEDDKTLDLAIVQDSDVETDETFLVRASNPIGCLISQADGRGRITNDDVPGRTAQAVPKLTIARGVIEGSEMVFRMTLDRRPANDVTMAISTSGKTAIAGIDYIRYHRRITIPGGHTRAVVRIQLLRTSGGLSSKNFQLRATDVSGASPSVVTAYGVIPSDSVASGSIVSISAGAAPLVRGGIQTFIVSRTPPTDDGASVRVRTNPGTARSPGDFRAIDITLFFRPGEGQKQVSVSTVRPSTQAPRPELRYNVVIGQASGFRIDPQGISAQGRVPAWNQPR